MEKTSQYSENIFDSESSISSQDSDEIEEEIRKSNNFLEVLSKELRKDDSDSMFPTRDDIEDLFVEDEFVDESFVVRAKGQSSNNRPKPMTFPPIKDNRYNLYQFDHLNSKELEEDAKELAICFRACRNILRPVVEKIKKDIGKARKMREEKYSGFDSLVKRWIKKQITLEQYKQEFDTIFK